MRDLFKFCCLILMHGQLLGCEVLVACSFIFRRACLPLFIWFTWGGDKFIHSYLSAWSFLPSFIHQSKLMSSVAVFSCHECVSYMLVVVACSLWAVLSFFAWLSSHASLLARCLSCLIGSLFRKLLGSGLLVSHSFVSGTLVCSQVHVSSLGK